MEGIWQVIDHHNKQTKAGEEKEINVLNMPKAFCSDVGHPCTILTQTTSWYLPLCNPHSSALESIARMCRKVTLT